MLLAGSPCRLREPMQSQHLSPRHSSQRGALMTLARSLHRGLVAAPRDAAILLNEKRCSVSFCKLASLGKLSALGAVAAVHPGDPVLDLRRPLGAVFDRNVVRLDGLCRPYLGELGPGLRPLAWVREGDEVVEGPLVLADPHEVWLLRAASTRRAVSGLVLRI